MITRLIKEKSAEKLAKKRQPLEFNCLNGNDVITAKVSDHHPIIHNGVLLWNVMKPGEFDEKKGFNNGFGITETSDQYMRRLQKVAQVIIEIIKSYPSVDAIGLCEGPVMPEHQRVFVRSLQQSDVMARFLVGKIYNPCSPGAYNWGLTFLVDKNYKVNEVECDLIKSLDRTEQRRLLNRFQIWELSLEGSKKYIVLGHLPFGGDEYVTTKENLTNGKLYSSLVNQLLNRYSDKELVLCADFNFNPFLIGDYPDRALDQVSPHNSVLVTKELARKSVTVDGILLSRLAKQKYHAVHYSHGLFSKLKKEHGLQCNQAEKRHVNSLIV